MLEHCCGDLLPFSHKNISEVEPGSQSAFQFIPKVFNGVKVRALCRPIKLFHTDLNNLISVHFTITALTVDRGSSSREEILLTDLLERWPPITVPS